MLQVVCDSCFKDIETGNDYVILNLGHKQIKEYSTENNNPVAEDKGNVISRLFCNDCYIELTNFNSHLK